MNLSMHYHESTASGGVPVRFFLTPEVMPDDATVTQLTELSRTHGLDHYVAVLPDIHRKSRNVSPTGTVVAARHALVPRAVDTGINCGIRMLSSSVDARVLDPPILDRLFGELMRTIPVDKHATPALSVEEVEQILLDGGRFCQERYGIGDDELDRIEDRATVPTDTDDPGEILAAVPVKAARKARRTFGTIGGGNHFLELQEITEILDPPTAEHLGLERGKVLFMLHTGSRGVGSKTMKLYVERLEARFGSRESPIWSVPADTDEAVQFARATAAVSNFGFANRIAITEKIRDAVRDVFADDSLSLPLIYDCAHVSIKRERWKGEDLWIHRHGASCALPPSRMADHPTLAAIGQPVPIPGSMGHDSFVGVAEEVAGETFGSVNHGAGRVLDKHEASARFTEAQVERELSDKRIRLYRYGQDDVAEQAPGSFKDITAVMKAMTALSLARAVVRLRPIAVLKG